MNEKGDYVSSGLAGADAQNKIKYAGMAELADALDSGSSEVTFVQVQVLLPAPNKHRNYDTKPYRKSGACFLFKSLDW